MVSEKVTVVNKSGFHMRPAQIFVGEMGKFQSKITILYNHNEINAKSIMHVMAACMKQGAELELRCEGSDENEALAKALDLIRSGLGEA